MLSQSDFKTAVRLLPLVAIDLLVTNEQGQVLVGRRLNPPAQGFWFVPGGRIRKGEILDNAFSRITFAELGTAFSRSESSVHGIYDHLYDDDFTGMADAGGTHYVVLAHRLRVHSQMLKLPSGQHDAYRWVSESDASAELAIHANTRAYFSSP